MPLRRLLCGYFLTKATAAWSLAAVPCAFSIFAAASRSPPETLTSACFASCAATPSASAQTSAQAERILYFIFSLPFPQDCCFDWPTLPPDYTSPFGEGKRQKAKGKRQKFKAPDGLASLIV